MPDGDQGQPPGGLGGSSPFGKQMSKVGILIDRAQRIWQMHGQGSRWKTCVSYAAAQLGNGFERLGVERHRDPPSRLHEALPHDLFPLLSALLLSLSTCPDKISQQSH
ncbi:MAG: hypothetical protein ACJ788_19140 [Ktedonobacteraceae bacterium]